MRGCVMLGCVCGVLVSALGGCATGGPGEVVGTERGEDVMVIELLGFDGCPNTPLMRENLAAALREVGGEVVFVDTDQEALAEGDLRRGWATPTVLVDGRDLFGLAASGSAAMGCRMYEGGVPGAVEIAERLRGWDPDEIGF